MRNPDRADARNDKENTDKIDEHFYLSPYTLAFDYKKYFLSFFRVTYIFCKGQFFHIQSKNETGKS